MSESTDRRAWPDEAEWILKNSGFTRCDSPACNCGSWHQTGGFAARFNEIKDVVEEAGYSTNGRTLLDAIKAMAADAAAVMKNET
jgi:hypothetical protein